MLWILHLMIMRILVYNFFFVISLSCFGTRVTLASQNELESVTFSIYLKIFCTIYYHFFLKHLLEFTSKASVPGILCTERFLIAISSFKLCIGLFILFFMCVLTSSVFSRKLAISSKISNLSLISCYYLLSV